MSDEPNQTQPEKFQVIGDDIFFNGEKVAKFLETATIMQKRDFRDYSRRMRNA